MSLYFPNRLDPAFPGPPDVPSDSIAKTQLGNKFSSSVLIVYVLQQLAEKSSWI